MHRVKLSPTALVACSTDPPAIKCTAGGGRVLFGAGCAERRDCCNGVDVVAASSAAAGGNLAEPELMVEE